MTKRQVNKKAKAESSHSRAPLTLILAMPLAAQIVDANSAHSAHSPYSPTGTIRSLDMLYSPPVTKLDAGHFTFDSVQDALDAFRRGEFVVVMDDDNRENEGDLICAASMITTEKMAWFIKHSRFVHFSLYSL
jgi:hypothetical protein